MYFILSFEKGESQRFVTYEMKLQTIHYIKWWFDGLMVYSPINRTKWYAIKYNSIQFSTMDPSLMYSKLWMASLRSPVVTRNAKIIWSFDKADTTWNPSVWLRELSKFLILTGHICDLCTLLTSHVWRFHDADLWL